MTETSEIRNIGLIGHVGTGKTSLADAILFNAGQNTRLGKVDQETSFMDYEPEEIKRKTTISSSLASFFWKNKCINLIDTPGSANYIADTKNCLQGIDAAMIILDSIDGVKIQSAKLIKQAEELNLPMAVIINKLERENSNYKSVLENLEKFFQAKPVIIQLPIGEEDSFSGLVSLLEGKAYIFEQNESGKYSVQETPEDLKAEAESLWGKSLETIVECDDEILEKYLEGQTLSDEEVKNTLRSGIINGKIIPVLFSSALKNIGIAPILDFAVNFFPSPSEKGEIKALNEQGSEVKITQSPSQPLAAHVFKTIIDPYAGHLSIIRVFSGKITPDSTIYNASKKAKERIGQIFHLVGKKHETISQALAGDIIAIAKLKDTHTGDTFSDEKNPVIIPTAKIPAPVISFALKPKNKGDEEKIYSGFKKLMEEDPALHLSRDEQTKEMIISGMGQVHLDVAIEKLKRKFGAEVMLESPKIPYKETISGSAKIQGKYKKQSGGKGQYGDCWIELSPLGRGRGFEFVDNIVGGAIPRQYIPAVENGIKDAMNEGVLAGFPAVDVKAVLYDGSYHPVDSSEMAFKVAGSMAFKKGYMQANPVLLEPVMHVEIMVPEQNTGDVMGDLNSRRGRMLGIDSDNGTQTIKTEIPMAEMLQYSAALNSMTSGAGAFSMEFSHYEEVPAHLAQKIIEQNKRELKEESL